MAVPVPPSYNTGLPNQLMNEEDIRQYFVRNGGVVKNTDIVSYFRPYLSNPAIKDEARIIFKTYVNKLASVKVENGEKYLVLKRQYFPPIDGNGNSATSGLPPVNSYSTQQYSQQSVYGHPNNFSTTQSGYSSQQPISASQQQRLSVSHPPANYSSQLQMNPHSNAGGGGIPPSYGHPPPPIVSTVNFNNLRRQNSQTQIYGSHFSLNSNYADPYTNANMVSTPQSQYYQHQHMSGLGHGHGGSTFSLASQYTTASSAGVPPYHHQHSQSSILYHQQQQPHHPVQPLLQRTLSQSQQTYAAAHQHQPVSQMQQQYSQQQHQSLPKTNFSGGASGVYAPSQVDYPPEYGLPPVNSTSSVNVGSPQHQQHQQQAFHRHLSPQNSGVSSARTGSLQRAPPPYRPPPPAANLGSPTSGFPPPVKTIHSQQQHMRRSSLSSSSMSGGVTGGVVRFNRSPSNPGPVSHYSSGSTNNLLNGAITNRDPYNNGPGAFQNQRSVSVSSGLPAAQGSVPLLHQQQTDPRQQLDYPVDIPGNSEQVPGAPPPPVPPRHKRGVERSPSAVSGASGSGSSSLKNPPPSSGATNFGGNRHSNRRNMDVTNGNVASGLGTGINGGMENDHEKENINLVNGNGTNGNFEGSSASSDGPNDNMQNGDSETEQKISVKERMQKFNRIASESELAASKMPSNRNKREIAAKHESVDFDTASLSSLEPRAKEWMLKSAQCDYHTLNKLAQENPSLVRRRDMNGYTCLHWAAKKGHVELVKLLAGAYQCDVNAKSNGGYTPLHLAAQFSRQEVYDLLVKAYNADVNIRDHSGKKPMQYLVRQDTSVSMDTFKSELLLSPDPSSVPGTRIRRHFSSASSIYPPNIRRRSSGSIPLEFVSLPTCNSNSASTTPNIPSTPISRRESSASVTPNRSVQLLSVSPIVSKLQKRNSFIGKNINSIFVFPETRKTASANNIDSSSKPEVQRSNSNLKGPKPGIAQSASNFMGGTSGRRSIRQGFNYLMNNAVPKKNKNVSKGIDENTANVES